MNGCVPLMGEGSKAAIFAETSESVKMLDATVEITVKAPSAHSPNRGGPKAEPCVHVDRLHSRTYDCGVVVSSD